VAITYHGVYNILVSRPGKPALVGYMIPGVTALLGVLFGRRQQRTLSSPDTQYSQFTTKL
jgi:hypothetical protein